MRLALVTDAWHPQVNGVVRTLSHTVREATAAGHEVTVISSADFRTIPCPTYPEIRLALFAGKAVRRRLTELQPDAVHVATEGPLGLAARNWCVRRGWPFTTAYHTQFPEYVRARVPLPLRAGYAAARWFHGRASHTLVTTPTMRRQLESHGFRNLALWGRGVDTELFRPRDKAFLDLPRPIWLYFGRVSVEKGVEEFLRLDLPGTKLVVGDGPATADLRRRHPDAVFAGYRHGGLPRQRADRRGGGRGQWRARRRPASGGPRSAVDRPGSVPGARPAIFLVGRDPSVHREPGRTRGANQLTHSPQSPTPSSAIRTHVGMFRPRNIQSIFAHSPEPVSTLPSTSCQGSTSIM